MEERKRFIEDWLRAGAATNVAALCRLYGISRTGYKWLERFRRRLARVGRPLARGTPSARSDTRVGRATSDRSASAASELGAEEAQLESKESQTSWPAASTIGDEASRTRRKRIRSGTQSVARTRSAQRPLDDRLQGAVSTACCVIR